MRTVSRLLPVALLGLCPFVSAEINASKPAPLSIHKTYKHVAVLSYGCKISIQMPGDKSIISSNGNPNGQEGAFFNIAPLPKQKKGAESGSDINFSLTCSDTNNFKLDAGVKYDKNSKKWVKDKNEWLDYLLKQSPGQLDPMFQDIYKQLVDSAIVSSITSVNSSGYYIIELPGTYGTGDAGISLKFCLIHPTKTLCGEGVIGWNRDSGNWSNEVFKIISTIEFLSDTTVTPSPSRVNNGEPRQ